MSPSRVRFRWLDEEEEEEFEEEQPLLRGQGAAGVVRRPRLLLCACVAGVLGGFLFRLLLPEVSAPDILAAAMSATVVPAEPKPPEPWSLVVGILSRERKGVARRQRLRALYGQAPGVLTRFVVSKRFAEASDEPDLLGVVAGIGGYESHAYKSFDFWRLATTLWDSRYYLKTDDDAVINMPLMLRLLDALDAAAAVPGGGGGGGGGGSSGDAAPLVVAGDINWGTIDLSKLEGHCWSTRPAESLVWKGRQCQGEHGPAPFPTGALVLLSAGVARRLSSTLVQSGWLRRSGIAGYWEDRLIGLSASRDERPVHMVYLNVRDHYDVSTHVLRLHGAPEPRAPSGQRAALFELEGPGGLLISHHVRGAAAAAAAEAAQRPEVQTAHDLRVSCRAFNETLENSAVGAYPASIRGWRSCVLGYRYAVGRAAMGYCAATTDEGDCSRGSKGSWNSTRYGITDLAGCAARCATSCERCKYVSFSRAHEDCSWFAECDLHELRMRWAGFTYESTAVSGKV